MHFMLRKYRSKLEPLDYSSTELLEWHFDGERAELKIYHRYLCFAGESGKLGWVRVGDKTISFPHDKLSPSDELVQGWQVDLAAEWDPAKLSQYNLICKFHRAGKKAALILQLMFLPDSVHLTAAEILEPNEGDASEAAELLATIRGDNQAFDRNLRSLLTNPFKYYKKYSGSSTKAFFDEIRGMICDLHVVRKDNDLMLVVLPHG